MMRIELSKHERWVILDALDAWIEREEAKESEDMEVDMEIVKKLRVRIEETVSYKE